MGETVSLAHARIEVEERPGYLLMVEHGTLRSVDDVTQYAAAMELLSERTGMRRALIDSRLSDATIEPPKDVRDAMWKWLLSARAFDQIAFVLGNEMHVARVNMTALSQRASIKAFAAVHEAHRWLTGRQRTLSQGMPAVTGGPLPIMPPGARTPTPPPDRPRISTPPPPASISSAPTRRSSEIAIPAAAPVPRSAGITGRFAPARPDSSPPPQGAPPPGTSRSGTPPEGLPPRRRSDVVPAAPAEPIEPGGKRDKS